MTGGGSTNPQKFHLDLNQSSRSRNEEGSTDSDKRVHTLRSKGSPQKQLNVTNLKDYVNLQTSNVQAAHESFRAGKVMRQTPKLDNQVQTQVSTQSIQTNFDAIRIPHGEPSDQHQKSLNHHYSILNKSVETPLKKFLLLRPQPSVSNI